MKSYLLTASLCSAVDWYKNCPPTWKDKAEKDLYNTVHRIWTGGSPEMKAGLDFEAAIYTATATGNTEGSEYFREVVAKAKGGKFQEKAKKIREITIPDAGVIPVCIYAKADVVFPALLLDIKTTGKYRKGKYLDTAQHLIYCEAFGIKDFQYVIAEWEGEAGQKIGAVHYEDFEAGEELPRQVDAWAEKTIGFLYSRPDLWQGYERIFSK